MARLVTLVDVKAYLNIKGTGDDDELNGFLLDAVAAMEDWIGPINPRPVVETIDTHSGSRVVLSTMPVQSVQSVLIQPWLGMAPIDDTPAWVVNPNTGVLRRNLTGGAMPYYGPGSVFTISYTAGRSDIPGPVNRAILMQVADMWRSQRGAMPIPSGGETPPMPYAGAMGFLAPAVLELIAPYLSPPGFA